MRRIFYAFMAVGSLSAIISAQAPPKGSSCQKAVEQFVCGAPIILPVAEDKRALKREDYKLTGLDDGVYFDLDGDGQTELTSWTAQSSHLAFLALDRNGN